MLKWGDGMGESLVPLDGEYNGAYGALFCRKCKTFLGYKDDYNPRICPTCRTIVDYEHKMVFRDGEWKKEKK